MKKDEPPVPASLRWDERAFLGMYRLGMNVFFPPVLLALSPAFLLERKRRMTLLPRLGFQRFPKSPPLRDTGARGTEKVLWVHALSVGEVLSAVPLIRELRPRINPARIYFSASTLSGYETAGSKLEGVLDGLLYFPLDIFFAVRRCVANVHPSLFVLVETDLWPGFMAELRRQRIPSFLVNARLSASSFKRYGQAKRLFSPVLNTFCRVYPQSPADAESFKGLGLNPNKLAEPGNLKFDAARISRAPAKVEQVRTKLAVQEGEMLLVAGSTHGGEELILRTAFLRLRQSLPELKLIVVPRHPSRAEEVRKLFLRDPLQVELYSSLPQKRFDVAVVDEFGVLSSLYEIGDLAYVGGSLVPKGGQNPLEAAATGKPVLFGPDMSDFRDVAGCMLRTGGAVEVKNGEELAAQAYRLLSDSALRFRLGAKNRALVEQNAGTASEIAKDILEWLGRA